MGGYTNEQLSRFAESFFNADDITIYEPSLGAQFFWLNEYLQVADVSGQVWRAGDNIELDVDPSGVTLNVANPITNIAAIDFSIGAVVIHQEGRIHWNADDHTIDIDTEVPGVSNQLGQELFARARNISGEFINDGSVVSVVGASGNRPEVVLANALYPDLAMAAVGLATHNIANNQTGYVTAYGLVRDINTTAFEEGDIVWLDTTSGGLTNVRPAPPAFQFAMGVVARKQSANGSIFVSPRWVPRLAWLSDVSIRGTQQDGDCIRWSDDTSTWISTSPKIPTGSPGSSDPGSPGEFQYDTSYMYVCTATDTWGRALLELGY